MERAQVRSISVVVQWQAHQDQPMQKGLFSMRRFSYYLFENFDADAHANNPLNPRRFLNANTDEILSYIARFPAGSCDFEVCKSKFGSDILDVLISGGIIRQENDCILFDTPIFLREDATALHANMDVVASKLANEIENHIPSIRQLCASISNGFSVETNLYHILCGMIFDGSFFDYLETNNAVATSRPHTSGLDYLSVIYEKCYELDAYSDGLLCSYNRFANSYCALQSFGDANGNRHDFYRFFRLLETGNLPAQYCTAQDLLRKCDGISKEEILYHVACYIKKGNCPASVLALLEHFGYVKGGIISVPIYTDADNETIDAIADVIKSQLGKSFVAELTALSAKISIVANKHGVSPAETANELYHILFGSINEELVRRGIVANPNYFPGEGRYLKSIQL